jgi:hypothetical protein
MTSPLIPTLTGRLLTVDAALKQPSMLRDRIAKLADDQILLPRLFRPFGAAVQGGGILYNVLQASDAFTSDVEKRAPGTEYKVVQGVSPEERLALVEDHGGKFQVADEQRTRNSVSYIDQQTTQLANTIARKLDVLALNAFTAAGVGIIGPVSTAWSDVVTVGPEASLTLPANRPTSHFSLAQNAADVEEMGVTHNLLIVHPDQAHELRVAYAENLDDMLKSAGFTEGMFVNARVPADTAIVVDTNMMAGTVGFEVPLTVDIIDERSTRSTWVQAYAVPAFAVDRPYAAKRILLP